MRYYYFILIAISGFQVNEVNAQLEFIPDVQIEISRNPNANGVFLINTTDNHFRFGTAPKYLSSLQIIDPLVPWPPIFFAHIKPGEEDDIDNGIFQDVRFQYATGHFSFFQKASHNTKGAYFISDTNFVILDTFTPGGNINGHGFDINSKGEFLYMVDMDTTLNLASYCNYAGDTAVSVKAQVIHIADKNHSVIFSWNPLHHIPFSDSRNTCYDIQSNSSFEKMWNWSHGNSLEFALDGNILYSYRHLGVGKINRQTGELMWKLGGKNPTIPVPSAGEFYGQHDFYEISPGIYSVFSCGDDDHPVKAIVFQIDEKLFKAQIVRIVEPSAEIYTLGTGNYEIGEKGVGIFNYGRYACVEERQRMFEIIDTTGRLNASYSSPCLNTSFQVHYVSDWKPAQPMIMDSSGTLVLIGYNTPVSWYQLAGTTAIHLADEEVFKPLKKGKYIAVAKKGFGWIISKPYEVK